MGWFSAVSRRYRNGLMSDPQMVQGGCVYLRWVRVQSLEQVMGRLSRFRCVYLLWVICVRQISQ